MGRGIGTGMQMRERGQRTSLKEHGRTSLVYKQQEDTLTQALVEYADQAAVVIAVASLVPNAQGDPASIQSIPTVRLATA